MMHKKNVLIIGGTGMLGHMVHHYFASLGVYELYNSVYRTPLNENSIVCDVKDQKAVQGLFEKTRPEVVINCVGALVQESKEHPSSAIYLNALFPHILKDFCNQYAAKLIHISTDCVFSGKKGNYREDDFRDADDVYGRSKALGEIFEEPHCTLRTSIIGPELKENGTGLFHWFMKQEGEVKGYTKVFWSGVTTLELSKHMHESIEQDWFGLIQITNGIPIAKYNLLLLFRDTFHKKTIIQMDEYKYADKSLLRSERKDYFVPSYEQMIQECWAWMKQHQEIYKQYLS